MSSWTVDNASYLTSGSRCPINSIILVFTPNCCTWLPLVQTNKKIIDLITLGTCFTSCPISWHPTANTTGSFDVDSNRARTLSNLLFCSVSLLAFSLQNSSLRWGGVQERWPDSSSDEYSSNVLAYQNPSPSDHGITLIRRNSLGALLEGRRDLLIFLGPSIFFRITPWWNSTIFPPPWLVNSPREHSSRDSTDS